MKNTNPAIDNYIADAADFARPVLEHWRKLVHSVCPDVQESVKWSYPHFDYKGDFMFVMAAYKNHCSFTFVKAALMSDARLRESKEMKAAQRFLGKITNPEELPSDKEFSALLKEAVGLNELGVKQQRAKSVQPKELDTPAYFTKLLAAHPKAKEVFDTKSPSFRKNYIVWITDAKTDATREKRMMQSLEWIAEGKGRFWQFEK
jgi:uncharacterized protein YdeI (YjbR/CyaY-like superfamily)